MGLKLLQPISVCDFNWNTVTQTYNSSGSWSISRFYELTALASSVATLKIETGISPSLLNARASLSSLLKIQNSSATTLKGL